MRTLDDAVDQFVYHPATPATAAQHSRVRDMFVNFLPGFWEQVPDGPEKTLALRSLQQAAMWANAAIAMTAPVDTSATRSVARVLPRVELLDWGPDQNGLGSVDVNDGHDYSDPRRAHAVARDECDCQ